MREEIRRVAVWSGWLRLAHWSLAGSTLVLLTTGWLVAQSPANAAWAAEMHYVGASILIFALGLRLILGMFGKGAERFESLLPRVSEGRAMWASLMFYLSLGRAPRPNWYAHNPLWKPLYLLLLLFLVALAISGWLMPETPMLGLLYLPHLHRWLADLVAILTIAHLFSVSLQDLKGGNADISAMLSGNRYFVVRREGSAKDNTRPVAVRLDDIGRS